MTHTIIKRAMRQATHFRRSRAGVLLILACMMLWVPGAFSFLNARLHSPAGGLIPSLVATSPTPHAVSETDSATVGRSWLISGPGDEEVVGAFWIQNNPVVVGNTNSVGLSGSHGARTRGGFDVFVRYSGATIYIGGTGDDRATAAYLFFNTWLYIVGKTRSRDLVTFPSQRISFLPTAQPLQSAYGGGDSDGFIARIDVFRQQVDFVTYFGGSGTDRLTGVVAPLWGGIVVCGETTSADFRTKQPIQEKLAGESDAIVAMLSEDGLSLLFSTYWGGTGIDRATAIASGIRSISLVVGGETGSSDFPLKNPLQAVNAGSRDFFVSRFDPAKPDVVFSTYVGGSEDDIPASTLVTFDDSILVAGSTESKNFPVAQPLHEKFLGGARDAVLLRIAPKGEALTSSTYWGGSGDDEACCLVMHRFGDLFLAGTTFSPNLPLLEPAQDRLAGGIDSFLAHFDAELKPRMATYFGGPDDDRTLGISYGSSIGLAGLSRGASFPLTSDSPDLPTGGVEGIAVEFLSSSIFLPNLSLSRIMQRELDFEVGPLPPGVAEVTIASGDPSRLLISLNEKELGNASANIPAKVPRPRVFLQGLEDSGTVPYTVRASDTVFREAYVTLLPASFYIFARFGVYGVGQRFRATTFQEVPLEIEPFVPAPLNATVLGGFGSIRPGVEPIPVELRLSDPAVGSVTPSTVMIGPEHPRGSSLFRPKMSGITTISLAVPPEFPISSGSQLEATIELPKLQMQNLSIGKNLQQGLELANPDPMFRTYEVTLTSGDPNCLLLSSSEKQVGTVVLKLTLVDRTSPRFYAQCLCSSGTTSLTAEVKGWDKTQVEVTFLPSGIVFLSGGETVVPLSVDKRTILVYLAGIVPAAEQYRSIQSLRPGVPSVSADVKTEPSDVATPIKGKVSFEPGGQTYDIVEIKPLKQGEVTVSVIPPEGFFTSPNNKQKLMVVDLPKLSIATDIRLGKDLQGFGAVRLSHPAPKGGYQVVVTSSDPSRLLLSTDRDRLGGPAVTVTVSEGSLGADYYMHSLESSGDVRITANVAGLPEATGTVTLEPSGFVLGWSSQFLMTENGSPEYIQVWAADIDPLSGHPATVRPLRPGFGTVSVEVRNSNPDVGVLENVPVLLPETFNSPRALFHPQRPGETILTLSQPPGFTNPASETRRRIVVQPRTSGEGESLVNLFVPIVLSAKGLNNALFTSELTLTNRSAHPARIMFDYTAAFGGGGGTGLDELEPGRQRIIPDAITYLRGLGIPIPDSGNRGGTLRITFSGIPSLRDAAATVRTTTEVETGRAGLAYNGVPADKLLWGVAYLPGLRQNTADRSNVAVQNAGPSAGGNITLRLTAYSGDVSNPDGHVLPDEVLAPGEFRQLSGILGPLGLSEGYVRVERISGTSPYYAYGVINDQATNDGSFVFPVDEYPLGRSLTLPVAVETSSLQSELVATNWSKQAKTLECRFVADAVQAPASTATFILTLQPGQQLILPRFVNALRQMGVAGIGPAGPAFVGPVFVQASSGDLGGIAISARTASPGGGGQYGLSYNAVPDWTLPRGIAWVFGLQQNGETRTNLALLNICDSDENPIVLRIDLFDGATGLRVNAIENLSLPSRRWTQIGAILAQYAPGVTSGYARVSRTSGANGFITYGVINDGGQPGERTGDGAYVSSSP